MISSSSASAQLMVVDYDAYLQSGQSSSTLEVLPNSTCDASSCDPMRPKTLALNDTSGHYIFWFMPQETSTATYQSKITLHSGNSPGDKLLTWLQPWVCNESQAGLMDGMPQPVQHVCSAYNNCSAGCNYLIFAAKIIVQRRVMDSQKLSGSTRRPP